MITHKVRTKLFYKMLLFIGAASLLPLSIVIAVASYQSYNTVSDETILLTKEQGRSGAALIKAELQLHLGAVRSLAAAFESFKKVSPQSRRGFFSEEVRATLERNPEAIAVWTQWEIGAIEDDAGKYKGSGLTTPRGGFSAAWYRDRGQIRLSAINDDTYDGDYYAVPRKRMKDSIINPYFYSYTGRKKDEVLEISICVPIIVDGKFKGIAGIDLPLDIYRSTINQIKVLETGYAILIANNGSIIAHPRQDLIGTVIGTDNPAPVQLKELERIKTGRPFEIDKKSRVTMRQSRQFFFPIHAGNTGTPWSLAVVIPLDELSRSATRTAVILILLGIAATIVILIAIFITSRSLTSPLSALSAFTERIAAGNFNERIAIRGTDEIAHLSASFNRMASRLRTTLEKYNTANRKLTQRNRALGEAQESLRTLNAELESEVNRRTSELNRAVRKLSRTNRELERSFETLHTAQDHIIAAEKMAVLGQLVASIAHELNTPLGAIQSSSTIIAETDAALHEILPSFFASLTDSERTLFLSLVREGRTTAQKIPDAVSRKKRRELASRLAAEGIPNPESAADDIEMTGGAEFTEEIIAALKNGKREILSNAVKFSCISRASFIILNASQKASKTVSALVDYSRQEDYDTSGIVAPIKEIEIILIIYYNSIKQGITIERIYETSSPVTGYRDRLNQVWINLINNAIQAMNFQGTLKIDIRRKEEWVLVSFTDSGPGIPGKNRDKVFQPFFTTKAKGEGTGLGLDICRKIIDRHGGKIEFASRPGKTTFTVFLKAATGQGDIK